MSGKQVAYPYSQEQFSQFGGMPDVYGTGVSVKPAEATSKPTFSNAEKVGAAAMGGGLAMDILGTMKSASIQKGIAKQEYQAQAEALRKDQRANIGAMVAQGAGTGLTGSSFLDIYNNQTIEDAIQSSQLKQAYYNKKAAIKNQKKAAIVKSVTDTAMAVATMGMSKAAAGSEKARLGQYRGLDD